MIAYGKWESVFRWLVGLFGISLLISISAMDTFSSLIAFSTLVLAGLSFKNKKPLPFFKLGPDLFILGFIVVVVLGLLINSSEGMPWLKHLSDLKWILLLYTVATAVRIAEPSERSLVPVCLILIVVSLYSLSISLLGVEPIQGVKKIHKAGEFIRTGGTLGSPMTFAQSFGQIFALVTGLFFVYLQRGRRAWIILGITAFFLGLTMVFTFTRGVWLGMAVATLLMAFLRGKKLGFAITALGLVAVLGAVAGSSSIRDRLTQVFDAERSYDDNRFALWDANLAAWKDHPLLGLGYNDNARRMREYMDQLGYPEDQYISHAHNQYIQVLAGTGILGLICFLAILFYFYREAFRLYFRLPERSQWQRGLVLGCIGAMTVLLIGGLTEANFEDSEVTQVWIFSVSILLWIRHDCREHENSTRAKMQG